MGASIKGFFDRVDVVFGSSASTTSVAAQGAPTEASIPSTGSIPIGEGTHIKKVSEATPIPTETLTP